MIAPLAVADGDKGTHTFPRPGVVDAVHMERLAQNGLLACKFMPALL